MNFTCIVAADINNGIGKNGQLPWPRLPADMAFFKKMTIGEDPTKKNVVIMGRKTWDSIPAKFRPLPDRINIVLSTTMTVDGENFSTSLYICRKGLDEAVTLAEDLNVKEIFIGGGGEVYAQALKDPRCNKIILTRIQQEFEADVFLPEGFLDAFTSHDYGQSNEHNGISFRFEEHFR